MRTERMALCLAPSPQAALRPWHLPERNAPICLPAELRRGCSPSPGPHSQEPKHETIWCESGLMKVQHGAKWVSTAAGWGANDKTAPWARCCCGYLCRAYGSWLSASLVRFSMGCILRARDAVWLSSLFRSVSLLACSFLRLLCSCGLLAWLLGNKRLSFGSIGWNCYYYYYCVNAGVNAEKWKREWYWLFLPVGGSVSFGAFS